MLVLPENVLEPERMRVLVPSLYSDSKPRIDGAYVRFPADVSNPKPPSPTLPVASMSVTCWSVMLLGATSTAPKSTVQRPAWFQSGSAEVDRISSCPSLTTVPKE